MPKTRELLLEKVLGFARSGWRREALKRRWGIR